MNHTNTLAYRLGVSTHESPLRFKLLRLAERHPAQDSACIEDWLIDVANSRGACVVFRPGGPPRSFKGVPENELSNEELVVAICQPQCLDRPQMLRLAAQLISRRMINPDTLKQVAIRERAVIVLAELARLAIHIEPEHEVWKTLKKSFENMARPKDTILHWTRLAEPAIRNGICDPRSWKLVA